MALQLGVAALTMAFISANWDLFAGFYIPWPDMPKPFLAAYYLNPMAYVLQSLAGGQLGGVNATLQVMGPDGTDVTTTVGAFLNDSYGIDPWGSPGMWGCVAVLVSFIVVFIIGSYLSLKHLNFVTR